jgi:hypothetical protein
MDSSPCEKVHNYCATSDFKCAHCGFEYFYEEAK